MIADVFIFLKKYPIAIAVLIIGWLVNLSLVLPINAHLGHDTYWHMALMSVAFKTFPPQVPTFAGVTLQGYNYLLDYIMYLISLIGIPVVYVYLIVMPLLYLILMTLLVTYFAMRFNKSIYFVGPFLFFTFLATPFSYLLSFYRRGSLFYGYHYPTAMQSSTALTNMAYAMTLPLIFGVLIILQNKKKSLKEVFILGLLVALAFGIKFYGGVVISFIIFFHLLLELIETKKIGRVILQSMIVIVPAGLSVLFFYDPFSSVKTGSIFGFSPLSTVHPLIENPDGLYIPYFVMARYTLEEAGGFSPRLMAIELFTIALYVFYNAGCRFIGFFTIGKRILMKQVTKLEITMITTIIFSATISMFFVQKGGDWWNTVQFFGYALLFLNFFAALFFYEISKKNILLKGILYFLIIILTLPLNIELVMRSLQHIGKQADVNMYELKALEFLKKQEDGVVFTIPVMYETSYVSALSEQRVYYGDENVLSNIGVDYKSRKNSLLDLQKFNLDKIEVKYLYILKQHKNYRFVARKFKSAEKYMKIFENREVIIYRKQK